MPLGSDKLNQASVLTFLSKPPLFAVRRDGRVASPGNSRELSVDTKQAHVVIRSGKVDGRTMTQRLDELTVVIRSKNAGPCLLTMDLVFPDRATFSRAVASLSDLQQQVADAYGRGLDEVRAFPYEPAMAIKLTLPRDVVAGDVGDSDIYGAQQHAPLLGLRV
jgi:Domain of unknown function (DUF4387)